MGYRDIQFAEEVTATYDEFVETVRRGFEGDTAARVRACRELLASIYFPGARGYDQLLADDSLPLASRTLLLQFDPENITLEHEHYTDIDPEAYDRVKPLVWFWMMYDRSPMGRNCTLGFRVRQVLAEGVFAACGKDLRIFHDVEFTWGYKLKVGEGTTLHRGVFLDDRGGLELGKKVSVSDFANVYTHTHDIHEISDVTNIGTTIGDGARLTYHSTVLAGVSVGADAMVAACALATKTVPDGWVWGGIPAKPIKQKDR
jgi:acetyltransferase-like isoleucine patch superfamily enzyme